MKTLFTIFLILHIASGLAGLLSGTFVLLMPKGNSVHKRTGKVFAFSMLSAGFSSLALSTLHPNTFLFMVGVFTVYMVASGFRALRRPMIDQKMKAFAVDYLLSLSMLVSAGVLAYLGVWLLLRGESFGIVYVVFSIFALQYVREDYKNLRGRSRFNNPGLMAHISRMVGGYIASLTAFLVVNARYIPLELPLYSYWLLPSVLVVPFIVKWSKQRQVLR